jgi:hypothetical protein
MLATYSENKWKTSVFNHPCTFTNATTCTVNNEKHFFMLSSTSLKELFYIGSKFYWQEFVPGKFVNSPIPSISPLSTLCSCTDADGSMHVFFFSNTGVLYDLAWSKKNNAWNFHVVGNRPSVPSCLFPSRVFNTNYEVNWDYNSLEVCRRDKGIDVFCNLNYSMSTLIPGFSTVVRYSLDFGC